MLVQLKKVDCNLVEKPTGERVNFNFMLGPIRVGIVVMLPYDDDKRRKTPTAYIKIDVLPRVAFGHVAGTTRADTEIWEEFTKDE
jgi:hypothetical protein